MASVFYSAVWDGPSPYTQAQRRAWVPHKPEPATLGTRLADQFVAVLEVENSVTGFIAMTAEGYIDLVFILPECRGRGGFSRLCRQAEEHARRSGVLRLWTHASLQAQPAFSSLGFSVIQQEIVERNGQHLHRAEMEKLLK